MSHSSRCWCGNKIFLPFGPDYQKCPACETLISASISETASPGVVDDERDFYGREYWFSHQEKDLGFVDITVRSRTDLPERCLHWLRVLFKYKLPPGRVLEMGSAHGGFVALLRWAGFEATGLELSPWLVEFAERTFHVPMLLGPVEKQQIDRGTLDVIALLDVLEHLPDPNSTMRHCLSLLKPDGILVIQTPCVPEGKTYEDLIAHGNHFKKMLQKKEHLYLFSRSSIHEFFHRLGADHLEFEQAIFSQYDMFFVVSRVAFSQNSKDEIEKILSLPPSGRLVQALMDMDEQKNSLKKRCEISEEDRAAQLKVIQELKQRLDESEKDRVKRLKIIHKLESKLRESEEDRAARLKVIQELKQRLDESEKDRVKRLKIIHKLESKLRESEEDRAARLKVIQELKQRLDESEKDRAARLNLINILTEKLETHQPNFRENNVTKQVDLRKSKKR